MVTATLANAAWLAAGAPAWAAFVHALDDPHRAQEAILRRYLRAAKGSAFDREHRLDEIKCYEDFADRVPIRDYDELEPWIDRVRAGEPRVLSSAPVRRLVPTSGSTAARKLIPYTDESHREFNRAVAPWIGDLFRRTPGAMIGPAYWSVTPIVKAEAERSAVPIGFDDDAAYLGGWFHRAVDAAMAVPASIRQIESIEESRHATLLHLLRRSDLALISVWHPSFLELLLDALDADFDRLTNQIRQRDRVRANEIAAIGPDLRRLWPKLAIVSCWADGPAAPAAASLARRIPGITIQPKGLLATEGVVSIPFAGTRPLAIRSHFLEFESESGRIVTAADLRTGERYRVILTTAGGLWRYRLNDQVRVIGRLGRTPTICFVGRAGAISDIAGEKLSEGFVAGVVARLFERQSAPSFSMLAPDAQGYTLYLSGGASEATALRLETLLRENPHYDYCRKLGQLAAARVVVCRDAYELYCERLAARGQRWGDIKPAALSVKNDWSRYFGGGYPAPIEASA